ncbi:MAG: hypothetical protein QOA70_06835 [Nitrososphaeraceae archaeon]|nr:hypothetical protein [Nitrososphaeraceae archaeon]
MNQLEKELNERAKKAIESNDDILADVKLLLDNNAKEEIDTLRSIGLDFDINLAEKKRTDNIIRKNGEDKFNKTILHVSDIEKFCHDYRLFLKPANKYVGTIPAELGAELTRYCKEKNIVLPSSSSYSRFYIMAPPSMFKGHKSFSEIVFNSAKKVIEERKERERLRRLDPILLYKLDDSDYFAVIKSWGNDFTINRKVDAFLHRPSTVNVLFSLFNMALVYSAWRFIKWEFLKFDSMDIIKKGEHKTAWFIVGAIIAVATLVGLIIWFAHEDLQMFRRDVKRELTKTE